MNLKKTALLALVLCLSVAYVFWVEVPREKQKEAEEKPFADVSQGEISEITIKSSEGEFALKNLAPTPDSKNTEEESSSSTANASAQWILNSIDGAELDSAALNGVTAALEGLVIGEPLPQDELDADRSVYGLSEPNLTLKVASLDSPQLTELNFGKKSSYLGLRYLELITKDGEGKVLKSGLYLVPDTLFTAANKKSIDFRKKNLIEFSDSKVKSAQFRAQETIKISKTESLSASSLLRKSPWIFAHESQDKGGVVSEEAFSELLRNMRNSKVVQFYDGPAAEERIPLFADTGAKEIRLQFTEELPELIISFIEQEREGKKELLMKLSDKPSVFVIDSSMLGKLFRSASDLREVTPFKVMSAQVQEIELVREGRDPMILTKAKSTSEEEEEKWSLSLTNGTSFPGDTVFIQKLLSDLNEMKVSDFPQPGASPWSDALTAKITVKGEGSGESDQPVVALEIGKVAEQTPDKTPKSYHARVVEGPAQTQYISFLIDTETLDRITPQRETLEAVPTPAPTAAVPAETPQVAGE